MLQRAKPADVRHEPFPYIVVNDALPDELYARLAEGFPTSADLNVDDSKNNSRWNLAAREVAPHPRINPVWKDLIAYHASPEFYREIIDLFYDQIHERYPKQFPSLEYARALRVGIRNIDHFDTKDILLDAMISGNTPVRTATSVRTTHVDQGRKLFSGLFYLRRDDDDSVGGDLTISRFKPEFRNVKSKAALFKGAYVDDQYVEVVETVKYAKNVAVIFINSIDSLHGVTVRQPTNHGRYFVNLVGDAVTPFYRFRKGRPHYVKLAWPMGMPVPPASIIARRLWERTRRQSAND